MAQFAGGVSYTPFAAQAMGNVGDAIRSKRAQSLEDQKNELASSAWMGDPQAMQELAAMDPQLAMQVEDQAAQRKATTEQRTMAKEASVSKKGKQFLTESDRIMDKLAKYDSYEEAQAFGQQMTDMLMEKYPEQMAQYQMAPEFTADDFAGIKTQYGAPAAKRVTKVVDGALVDEATGDVVYQAPEGGKISDRKTQLVETPEGQILIDSQTGDRITEFAAKPIKATAPKEPTGEEKKSAGYLSRMTNAESEIDRLEAAGFDRMAKGDRILATLTPGDSGASTQYKQYTQAARDWIRAKLRKESGAVIAESEMEEEFDTYFPSFGDTPEVVAQKRRSRKQAEEQLKFSAGRAWKEPEAPTGAGDLSGMSDEELDRMIAAAEGG